MEGGNGDEEEKEEGWRVCSACLFMDIEYARVKADKVECPAARGGSETALTAAGWSVCMGWDGMGGRGTSRVRLPLTRPSSVKKMERRARGRQGGTARSF